MEVLLAGRNALWFGVSRYRPPRSLAKPTIWLTGLRTELAADDNAAKTS